MAASSSNSESFIVEVGEEFPYPSHVIAPYFFTVKLSGKDKYDVWKTQMLCLLRSHGMLGFIDDQKYGKWILVKHKKNAWMRSDSLVTGWILGSLSEEVAMEVVNCLTSKHNNTDFTAKDAWDELQRRYGPSVAPELPKEKSLLDLVNSDGSTLLHVAAIFGNTEAARILLDEKSDLSLAEEKKNINLLLVKDKDDRTPLALSLYNMHTETSRFLINRIIQDDEKKKELFSGKSGDDVLVLAISSKKFGLAMDLLEHYDTIHGEAVLMAIAQNFPSQLKFWGIIRDKEDIIDRVLEFGNFRCIGLLCGITMIRLYFLLCFGLTLSYIVWPFIKNRVRVLNDAFELLWKVCQIISENTDHSDRYYLNPVFEATRQNAFPVVHQIVWHFPNAIQGHNEDGHDFIQYAIINRSEGIYNMLFQMSVDIEKNKYKTITDLYENNLLHLAAKLAPSNKLELISGAALRIQRELQWCDICYLIGKPLYLIEANFYKSMKMLNKFDYIYVLG